MRTERTKSRTQADHDAPPHHGDRVYSGNECVAIIDSVQQGLFGAMYHNNVHDVADLKGAMWHVERAPKYDTKAARAWRPAPRKRKPPEELD